MSTGTTTQHQRNQQRRELLAALLKKTDKRSIPMSFQQQRLWFLSQMLPDTPAYLICRAFDIDGTIDIDALQAAVNSVVARHEALRTSFGLDNNRPIQNIHATLNIPIRADDVFSCPNGDDCIAAAIGEEMTQPFSLDQLPLLRLRLLRKDASSAVLIITMHHIIADAWSMNIFFQELSANYRAAILGETAGQPPLTKQYGDYAIKQHQLAALPEFADQLHYWQNKIGKPTLLSLPTARPRPMIQSLAGASHRFTIDQALSRQLEVLGQAESSTAFMVLLAVFQILLSHYTGQQRIAIGTPIAGRTEIEMEALIGFFANTLVLSPQISPTFSFRTALREVRATAIDAYAHQHLPFEKLVDALQPERNPSYNPLFQVMFSLQNAPAADLRLAGTSVRPHPAANPTAKFDLNCTFEIHKGQFVGVMEYATDLFDQEMIEDFCRQYETLAAALVNNPDTPIWRLAAFKQTDSAVDKHHRRDGQPRPVCVQTLFEQQVADGPHRPAVVWNGQSVSYGALDRQANQLARQLIASGVRPGGLVGLYLERSINAVAAMLAVLKASATYVPFDPSTPRERLAAMQRNVPLQAIITQASAQSRLDTIETPIICIDRNEEAIARYSVEAPARRDDADHMIYMIFTSGSTGQPKGAGVSHQGFNNLLNWYIATFRLDSADRILILSSLSFDLTQKNIFAALSIGATIHMPAQGHYDPAALTKQIESEAISLINCTPSAFYPLIDACHSAEQPYLKTLRTVVLGGEPIVTSRLLDLTKRAGFTGAIANTYGPTECSDVVAGYELQNADYAPDRTIPIGRPIWNTELFVLDEHMQIVPPGVPGELYIAGDGVGYGYCNAPEQSAAKFVPHPFASIPGSRIYKTGDLVRQRRDGQLEFIGRLDFQVKIRGFRIELKDIEASIDSHPAILQSVVVAQTNQRQEQSLVGFYICREHCSVESSELRIFLKERLPDYMIPAVFSELDGFPVTVSGKIDRKALPMPKQRERKPMIQGYNILRDSIATQILQIWEETLGLKDISPHDNFFDLGGHSIIAIPIIEKVSALVGKKLPITLLFQNPSVAQLITHLRMTRQVERWSPLVKLRGGRRKAPFFYIHPLGGGISFYAKIIRYVDVDQPVYGLQSRGLDITQQPDTTIEAMAEFYITAIRKVQPQGPYFLGGWSLGGTIAYEMAQQLWAAGQEIGLLAIIDTDACLPDKATGQASGIDDLPDLAAQLQRYGVEINLAYAQGLEPAQQLAYLLQQGIASGFLPEYMSVEEMRRKSMVIQLNQQAKQHYRPRKASGSIAILRSLDQPDAYKDDPTLGWEELAPKQVVLRQIPCIHAALFTSPNIEILGNYMSKLIDESLAQHGL